MSSQEDCYFFFNSTCTKGDDCAFRHEHAALGKSVLCEQWKNGTCGRNPCHLRHGIQENNQMPKSTIPCYYENQPSGCLSYLCQFLHRKPRPFVVDYQLNHAVQPSGNLRPAMPHPRLNIPFQQRFVPPHMQQFRVPARPRVDFSPRKMQSMPPRFPATDIRHALFTNPPRELVPGPNFRAMRPRLFDERGLGSMNGPVVGNQQQAFEARLLHNVMKNPPLRVPMASDQQKLALDVRKMSNVSQLGKLNDGQGLLGEPPLLPFPFGGVFPFNIIPQVNKMVAERSKSRSSGKDSSKPRTVKKLDSKSRHRKSFKTVRRRVERRSSQDAVDVKKERKEKRSFTTKDIKDTSSRERKVKRDRVSSKKSKRERRPVDVISTVKDDDKDAKKGDKEMADGANLPFKVKSLEEILRDKALKKLRERQQMKEALSEGDKNAKTRTSLEKKDLNTELGVVANVYNATDKKDDSVSQPQPRKVPTLKTKKKENDKTLIAADSKDVVVPGVINVGEELTSGVDDGKSTDSAGSKTSGVVDNAKSNGKRLHDQLSTVKVKTLDEIKRSKLKRLDLAHAKSALNPKAVDLNKSPKDCKLKPLKPLTNYPRRKSLGTSGSNHGSSGNSSTQSQTSDDDKKEPLPPITRTPKIQGKTIHDKTMAVKLLKRKLASQLPNDQPAPAIKVQKLITNSETEQMGSAVKDTVNKTETKKQDTLPKESNISPSLETVKKNNVTVQTMSRVRKRKLVSSNLNEKTQNENFTPGTSSNNLMHSTSMRNDQIGATDTQNSVEKYDVCLESSLNQNPVEEVDSKKHTETAKPVKKIKLKRMGFNGTKTGNEDEGKSSGLGRTIRVNRKKPVGIKEDAVQLDQENMNVETSYLRRNKEVKGKESLPMATSQTATNNSAMTLQIFTNATTVIQISPVVARTPQISTSIPMAAEISTNITKDTHMSTSIARNPQKSTNIPTVTQIPTNTTTSTQMSTNTTRTPQLSTSMPMAIQISTNTPRNPWISTNTTTSTQMSTNVIRTSRISATTATHVSSVVPSTPQVSTNTPINTQVSTKTTTGSEVNKSLATSTWMSTHAAKTVNIAANISDTSQISPNTVNINHERIDFPRKSTLVLDRLVKEVSDDIRDEGDVLLDEALERAIAEMSPVPTDDEDEISNADDLLLEIEEMIYS